MPAASKWCQQAGPVRGLFILKESLSCLGGEGCYSQWAECIEAPCVPAVCVSVYAHNPYFVLIFSLSCLCPWAWMCLILHFIVCVHSCTCVNRPFTAHLLYLHMHWLRKLICHVMCWSFCLCVRAGVCSVCVARVCKHPFVLLLAISSLGNDPWIWRQKDPSLLKEMQCRLRRAHSYCNQPHERKCMVVRRLHYAVRSFLMMSDPSFAIGASRLVSNVQSPSYSLTPSFACSASFFPSN